MDEVPPTAAILLVGIAVYELISPEAWLIYAVVLAVAGIVIRLLGLG